MPHTVHVFGIKPGTRGEEAGYAYPFWEPEPSDGVSDEVYEAWEDRNPIWGLRDDLGLYLDSDFVETHLDSDEFDFWDYLGVYVTDPADIETIRERLSGSYQFVLVFSLALEGAEADFSETEGAWYAGEFPCKFNDYDDGPTPQLQTDDHTGRILIAKRLYAGLVVTAGRYGEVRFWNTQKASSIETVFDHSTSDFVHAVELSADETSLYTSSNEVLHWDLTSWPIESRLVARHGGYQMQDLAILPGKNTLIVACVDKTVGVIDLLTGEEQLLTHDHRVTAVLSLLDGEHFVSVASDTSLDYAALGQEDATTFTVWRTANRQRVREVNLPKPITRLCLLNDGLTILYGTEKGQLVWWDWRASEATRIVSAHDNGWVNIIEQSEFGQLLLTAGDSTAKLWRVDDGQPIATFAGHTDRVLAACFLEDDYLVTGSKDATIRVWQISKQAEVAKFTDAPEGRPEIPSYLDDPWEIHAVVADGRTIVAGETSGRVRILKFADNELHLRR